MPSKQVKIAIGVIAMFFVAAWIFGASRLFNPHVIIKKEERAMVNESASNKDRICSEGLGRDYSIPFEDKVYEFSDIEQAVERGEYSPDYGNLSSEEKMRHIAYHGKRWREKWDFRSLSFVIEMWLKKEGMRYEDVVRVLGDPQDDCRKDGYTNYYPPGCAQAWVIGWTRTAPHRFDGSLLKQ